MRRFLVPLVAFAAPFVLFALYRLMARKHGKWPMAALFVAGAVLAVQAFALSALTEPALDRRPPPAVTETAS